MKPGIYTDLDELDYHAEPSLSVSGAKKILDCPARYRWERDNPPRKDTFDFGHAAHAKVLGVGLEIVTCPTDLLASNGAASTKAAKEWIAQARADGKIVMKAEDLAVIDAMAAKVEEHADAAALLAEGEPETSFCWRDEATGLLLRGRADWITTYGDVPVVVDYKTTTDANPDAFRWEAGRFGYHMQDAWYREGLDHLTGEAHGFVFIVQEKTAPYLVSVVELDDDARDVGAQRNAVARRLFQHCTATDTWPAYPGIARVSVPNARPAKEYINV